MDFGENWDLILISLGFSNLTLPTFTNIILKIGLVVTSSTSCVKINDETYIFKTALKITAMWSWWP